MKQRPFSIQTFYPYGDTEGYRICQIPTRTIQAIYIPRKEINKAIQDRNELKYNALYFLFQTFKGESNNEKQYGYIGESESIAERLKNHDKNKNEWEVAIVFTTTGAENQLTKADIKYLENYCYQKALEAERYFINQNNPTK
ncbi:GIY-YIG nuclease family protein [Staphylococcus equorum]|uniref:GIY-YIG nuclease family protein n=1 Tax=Staphylococcus equorum TaxID=246432 RepID=UPI0029814F94|nr:GIY-YIG nuclease family protein [Staphylococcus equorum]MDW5470287.1 GIY-YIG nuclease family protein [Staphylococcus equorum]